MIGWLILIATGFGLFKVRKAGRLQQTLLAIFLLTALWKALGIWEGQRMVSDRVMIAHFYENKQDFERLVRIYRSGETDSSLWLVPQELKAKTEINRIQPGPGYWFDNPYSIEGAENLEKMYKEKSWADEMQKRRTLLVKMDIVDRGYKKDGDKYAGRFLFNGGYNWRDYVHYPIDPDIVNGRIRYPREVHEGKQPRLGMAVKKSLNNPRWKRGDCVLRKIEPHWYLSRCRAQ